MDKYSKSISWFWYYLSLTLFIFLIFSLCINLIDYAAIKFN